MTVYGRFLLPDSQLPGFEVCRVAAWTRQLPPGTTTGGQTCPRLKADSAGSVNSRVFGGRRCFPLGMYSVATCATAPQMRLRPLTTISLVFFWIAVTVWLLVSVGLGHQAMARSRTATR